MKKIILEKNLNTTKYFESSKNMKRERTIIGLNLKFERALVYFISISRPCIRSKKGPRAKFVFVSAAESDGRNEEARAK